MNMDLVTAGLRLGLVEFNWTFVFQLVNTLILYLILRKFLFGPVTSFMQKRENEIKKHIEDAERLDLEAQSLKVEYEQRLVQAEEEGKVIIKKYSKRAENRAFEIVKTAEAEVETMKLNARRELERERVKALNELKGQISELTILAASKVIEKELDEVEHKELIDKFLGEVGETQWQN